ncbi:peptidyl-alpha-hydroxyglycine alpha-amidating lyase 2-like isoform X2 [Oratosquilla oratoria]|uniref:peptidyl-alpha-hydroxyglycine alpha-amidating lyase 2-like isoform X2 n=1 Tax=Oratosquilla oratoria TaxID=337810 RepID=UPI003F769A2D
MKAVRFGVGAICLLFAVIQVSCRNVPIFEFNDDFYSENPVRIAHPREVRGWGPTVALGEVAGVSVDLDDNPVIFHRGGHIWDYGSFNATHHYQGTAAIDVDPVLTLDQDTGEVIKTWGKGRFYLPHGITIDSNGNMWLTDVALHQVFKYEPNQDEPALILGEAFHPGSDDGHFCKPTGVAVAESGEFFISDGYCNARILRFHPDGTLQAQFGRMDTEVTSPHSLYVPHGLTLDQSRDALCVADREHRRVLCVTAGLVNPAEFGQNPLVLQEDNYKRIYDVAALRGVVVGVAGNTNEKTEVKGLGSGVGFSADLDQGQVVDEWTTISSLHNPHSIAVSQGGSAIYVTEIGPNKVWKFVLEPLARYKY